MKTVLGALIALILIIGPKAHGTLGEKSESLNQVQAKIGTDRHTVVKRTNHIVHEMSFGAGNTLREFVNVDGRVFSVCWFGQSAPDLSVVLGSYYSEFKRHIESQPQGGGRKPAFTSSQNLTIERSGHMGAIHGCVHLDSARPQGITAGEIQ